MILSFKDIFARYGKTITKWLTKNIEVGGADWVGFVPKTTKGSIKTRLTKGGKERKSVGKDTGSHQRMIVTGNTKNKAFKYRAEDEKLTIFVDTQKYVNIIEGNNAGGPFKRANQVHLFPIDATVNSFEKTQVIQDLKGEVTKEMTAYFKNILDVDLNKVIKI